MGGGYALFLNIMKKQKPELIFVDGDYEELVDNARMHNVKQHLCLGLKAPAFTVMSGKLRQLHVLINSIFRHAIAYSLSQLLYELWGW